MFYIRGSRHDYDTWAEMGADGWSYKDVLPYFIKSENIQIPELQQSGKILFPPDVMIILDFAYKNFFKVKKSTL